MTDRRTILPPADIYETKDKYFLVLDMPGADKSTINVTCEGETLSIQAGVTKAEGEWKLISEEFELSDYSRRFEVGTKINRDTISARYDNGILTIELDKSEQMKPKKIEVIAA